MDDLQAYYGADGEEERLLAGVGRLEHERTMRLLARFVAPGSRVADVGGGTGRYAEWAAGHGCAVELLDATVRRYGPDRPCLRTPEETWTYGDLLRTADGLAWVLVQEYGLVPGNRVLLRGPNNPWLVAAWFAVLKAGGVAVTTMPLLRPMEIAALVEVTEPDLAVCDHRFTADLTDAASSLPVLVYGDGDLAKRCAAKDEPFEAVDTAADDVALLAPTSGTTGRPKATMHFHRDVLAIADTFSRHLVKPVPEDVFTGTPPIGFTFGLGEHHGLFAKHEHGGAPEEMRGDDRASRRHRLGAFNDGNCLAAAIGHESINARA